MGDIYGLPYHVYFVQVKDIKPAMKDNVVKLLHTTDGRVNIKARTHEKVCAVCNIPCCAAYIIQIK